MLDAKHEHLGVGLGLAQLFHSLAVVACPNLDSLNVDVSVQSQAVTTGRAPAGLVFTFAVLAFQVLQVFRLWLDVKRGATFDHLSHSLSTVIIIFHTYAVGAEWTDRT